MSLDLVVSLYSLLIAGRYTTSTASLLSVTPRAALLLMRHRAIHRRRRPVSLIGWLRGLIRRYAVALPVVLDDDVSNVSTFGVLR